MHTIAAQKEMIIDGGEKHVSVLRVHALACPVPAPPAQRLSQSGVTRRDRTSGEIKPNEGCDPSGELHDHDVGML